MTRASRITDERLASLYEADGFGGEKTMRAKVIRELIDEIRALRQALAQAEGYEAEARTPRGGSPLCTCARRRVDHLPVPAPNGQ